MFILVAGSLWAAGNALFRKSERITGIPVSRTVEIGNRRPFGFRIAQR